MDLLINEKYINELIEFCNNFIKKYDVNFSLKVIIFKFDKISPTFEKQQKILKIYANQKEIIHLVKGIKLKKPRIKKSKKQIFYFGKTAILSHSVNERKSIYEEVIVFCNYIRQLKILIELRKEQKKLNNISFKIKNYIKDGF